MMGILSLYTDYSTPGFNARAILKEMRIPRRRR